MSDFKSQCGCEIHVTQWSSKRKIASVKNCPLHKSAPALREALKEAIAAIQVFHGPGWEIYRDCSPEMKRWKALLEITDAIAEGQNNFELGEKL